MLVTWYRALTYNASLELLHTTSVNDTFQHVKGIQVCVKDIKSANSKGFLISFQVDKNKIQMTNDMNIEHSLTALDFGYSSLIYRC